MTECAEHPKGYRFPKGVISYAVYLYHRFLLSYRDVQELLFERGVDVSHETVRAWCAKFGPDLAEALRHRRPRRGRSWHGDEMRVVVGGVVHWLWRAVNEHGDVLDVLLQKGRDTRAAKRFFRRLLDEQDVPERVVTDGLRSYGAALRELPELGATEHVTLSRRQSVRTTLSSPSTARRETRNVSNGASEGCAAPKAFSLPTAKSIISFAIPAPVRLPDCAATTGCALSGCGTNCCRACPKKL